MQITHYAASLQWRGYISYPPHLISVKREKTARTSESNIEKWKIIKSADQRTVLHSERQ